MDLRKISCLNMTEFAWKNIVKTINTDQPVLSVLTMDQPGFLLVSATISIRHVI